MLCQPTSGNDVIRVFLEFCGSAGFLLSTLSVKKVYIRLRQQRSIESAAIRQVLGGTSLFFDLFNRTISTQNPARITTVEKEIP